MVEHFPCGTSGPDWRFSWGHGMTRGYSPMAPSFVLWRPPEFLVEGAEELAEQETTMIELEIKDVEFEEDHVEVVWWVVNPHQIHNSGVDPYWA